MQREKKLAEKSRIMGLEYLENVRHIPKPKKKKSIEDIASKTDRISYENYLTHKQRDSQSKQWHKILNSDEDKQTKAIHLQCQSEKLEEELRRKELEAKVMKKEDDGIDQEYFDMIKAKLDLLQSK